MKARFLIVIFVFLISLCSIPLVSLAQSNIPDSLISNVCANNVSPELQNEILSSVKTNILENYGDIVKDSVESMCARMHEAFLAKTFFVPSINMPWVPETISFNDKLKSILEGATTRTDSIDNICHWVASRYPFGDPDVDSNFANRSLDSTWKLMNQGNLSGLCGEFSVFFSKIVESYFPAWGVPVQFYSVADTSLTLGGRGLPSHVWVGLAHKDGEVYAVCDPTLGGVVKDGVTGKLLSLNEVFDFLRSPEKAFRPYIRTVLSSFQTYGPHCVPYIMLVDRETPIYYNTPIEVVKAIGED